MQNIAKEIAPNSVPRVKCEPGQDYEYTDIQVIKYPTDLPNGGLGASECPNKIINTPKIFDNGPPLNNANQSIKLIPLGQQNNGPQNPLINGPTILPNGIKTPFCVKDNASLITTRNVWAGPNNNNNNAWRIENIPLKLYSVPTGCKPVAPPVAKEIAPNSVNRVKCEPGQEYEYTDIQYLKHPDQKGPYGLTVTECPNKILNTPKIFDNINGDNVKPLNNANPSIKVIGLGANQGPPNPLINGPTTLPDGMIPPVCVKDNASLLATQTIWSGPNKDNSAYGVQQFPSKLYSVPTGCKPASIIPPAANTTSTNITATQLDLSKPEPPRTKCASGEPWYNTDIRYIVGTNGALFPECNLAHDGPTIDNANAGKGGLVFPVDTLPNGLRYTTCSTSHASGFNTAKSWNNGGSTYTVFSIPSNCKPESKPISISTLGCDKGYSINKTTFNCEVNPNSVGEQLAKVSCEKGYTLNRSTVKCVADAKSNGTSDSYACTGGTIFNSNTLSCDPIAANKTAANTNVTVTPVANTSGLVCNSNTSQLDPQFQMCVSCRDPTVKPTITKDTAKITDTSKGGSFAPQYTYQCLNNPIKTYDKDNKIVNQTCDTGENLVNNMCQVVFNAKK